MRRLTTISALCLLLLGIAANGLAGDEDRILSLYRQGKTAAADRLADTYLADGRKPEEACPVLLAGALADRPFLSAKNRLRQCIETCRKQPEAARARAAMARLLHLAGENRNAMVIVNEFLEKHPDDSATPEMLLLRGALELRLPPGATSGRSFATFLAKYSGHPLAAQALAGVGDIKIRQRDWQGATDAYHRALRANPAILDLPTIYFHLGLAAEHLGNQDMARHYYDQLLRDWPNAPVAWRAKDRLDSALAIGRGITDTRPLASSEKWAASVGVFDSLADAEHGALRFTEAGMRVYMILRGKRCELLVGQFDSEQAAKLFANEVAQRFGVRAAPQRLP